MLNKIDQVKDVSYLDVLKAHHPRAVAVSAAKGDGLEQLRKGVIDALSADFAEAEIETGAANGRVLAYLAAHADIYRQQFDDSRVIVRCYLPRHLLHHIQGPDVAVRFLDGSAQKEDNPSVQS